MSNFPTYRQTGQVDNKTAAGGASAASQSTVDAGTNTTEFVNPSTLANTTLIERAYQSIPYNGSMVIWQRGTSFAAIADGAYSADGWKWRQPAGVGVFTVSQSSDVPTVAEAGILAPYSLLVDCTTIDASIDAADLYTIGTRIEGFDFAQIAQRAFINSFWAKATKTGTYCISYRNSGADRSYVAEFTIDTTNTWEYKVIPVLASPSAGTWDYTTGIGLTVEICIAGGSNYNTTAGAWQTGSFLNTSNQVNGADSTSNDFRIALFDIVPGSYDRPFPIEDYQKKLARCKRYYNRRGYGGAAGTWLSTTEVLVYWNLDVEMRIAPTLTLLDTSPKFVGISPTTGALGSFEGSGSAITGSSATPHAFGVAINGFTGATAGQFASVSGNQVADGYIIACSAEL